MKAGAIRSLISVAAMLASNEVCAFVAPGGLHAASVQALRTRTCTSLERRSRRWNSQDAGSVEASGASETGSPFSSWGNSIKKAARRFGRGPLSRAAKDKDAVDDLLNSEAFLNKKVEMLKKQIRVTQEDMRKEEEEAEKQWKEWGPQVARLEKEFELLKSRGGEAVTKAYDKGKAEALNDVLVVADNFERAAAAISAETDGERAVVAYYKDAYDTMMGCLKGLGLTEVETIGAPFDYNIHNAIMRENTNEISEDCVCQVFQKGYLVGDTLVRPAMVAVAVPA